MLKLLHLLASYLIVRRIRKKFSCERYTTLHEHRCMFLLVLIFEYYSRKPCTETALHYLWDKNGCFFHLSVLIYVVFNISWTHLSIFACTTMYFPCTFGLNYIVNASMGFTQGWFYFNHGTKRGTSQIINRRFFLIFFPGKKEICEIFLDISPDVKSITNVICLWSTYTWVHSDTCKLLKSD